MWLEHVERAVSPRTSPQRSLPLLCCIVFLDWSMSMYDGMRLMRGSMQERTNRKQGRTSAITLL